jgi:hypothetical protein
MKVAESALLTQTDLDTIQNLRQACKQSEKSPGVHATENFVHLGVLFYRPRVNVSFVVTSYKFVKLNQPNKEYAGKQRLQRNK